MTASAAASREPSAAPKVSVVIIFLNGEPFLGEAIDSLLRQTLTDWELILIDDGSSDASPRVAEDYLARYPDRIRLLTHPGRENRGMSASRNLGMQAARGTYLAFLDADDIYLPHRLEHHVRVLDAWPAVDMVQSDLIFWYSWREASQRPSEDCVRPFLASSDRILPPPHGLLLVLAAPLLSAGICNITIRRQVALELGGFDPRFRALYEDQVFVSKVYLERTVYVLQEYLAKYRRHGESAVRRMKASGEFVEGLANESTKRFQQWLVQYVQQRGISHPMLLEALAHLTSKQETSVRPKSGSQLARTALTAAKAVLLRWLPAGAHRRLMQWSWNLQVRRALRQYRQLCARMERAAMQASASEHSHD